MSNLAGQHAKGQDCQGARTVGASVTGTTEITMTRPLNASLATVTVTGRSYPPGHGGRLPYLLHPV